MAQIAQWLSRTTRRNPSFEEDNIINIARPRPFFMHYLALFSVSFEFIRCQYQQRESV